MKIERLRNKRIMLIFLCGFLVVVVLLITLVFKGSKAKYRNSNIIPLINTKVTNKVPDFTTMGIFIKNSSGEYKEQDTLPSEEGYIINESKSSCTKFNSVTNTSEPVTGVRLYTDVLGNHSLRGIKKGYKCYIYFDKGILGYNNIGTKLLLSWGYHDITTITERTDFTKKFEGRDTTNNRDWVYKAEDDDGWSYYLAGNPTNNWVKFGGYYWRIVRINGDGTLRMIYSGRDKAEVEGAPTQLSNVEVASISASGTYPYNHAYNKSSYVGYWYNEDEQYGLGTKSSIYNVVNDFYNNKISNSDKAYIDTNAGFCNDRSVASDSSFKLQELVLYAPRERINGLNPTLKCKNQATDLFTSKIASRGNKMLDNPIGLLTIDEAMYAGLGPYSNIEPNNNYLATGSEYWTMSPAHFNGPSVMWYIYTNGGMTNLRVNESERCGIRPVINLKKDITFSKGNGLSTNPFEI